MRQCFVVVYACLPSLSSSLSSSFGLPVNRKTQEYRKPLINEITPQFTANLFLQQSLFILAITSQTLIYKRMSGSSTQCSDVSSFQANVPLVINSNDEPYIRFYTDAASQFL